MIVRPSHICVCMALFICVTSSDDIVAVEEKEQTSLLSEQLPDDLIDPQDFQMDYSNITLNDNDTIDNSSTNINSTLKVTCLKSKTLFQPVQIVNATHLASILQVEANITSRQTPAQCVAVLFYSPSCPFSSVAAPYFNTLSWYYPDIKLVAIDALTHRTFSGQYGIFGIPTLILFHNGRPAAKLNETSDYNLRLFVKFIHNYTNLGPTFRKLNVMYRTFNGPITPVPVNERDYYLILSWGVIILQLLYSFYRSSWGRWLVDATLSAWREAEAQHHHID